MGVVEFCNANEGFVSGVLSFFTFFLTNIAIVVSIYTAHLPYRKKISLKLQLVKSYSSCGPAPVAYHVKVLNIGNIPVSIEYVGFAYKENRKIKRFIDFENPMQHYTDLGVNESFEVPYSYVCHGKIEETRMFLVAIEACGKSHKVNHRRMMKKKDTIIRASITEMRSMRQNPEFQE